MQHTRHAFRQLAENIETYKILKIYYFSKKTRGSIVALSYHAISLPINSRTGRRQLLPISKCSSITTTQLRRCYD